MTAVAQLLGSATSDLLGFRIFISPTVRTDTDPTARLLDRSFRSGFERR